MSPKLKTRKSIAKRFKLTKKGKVKRNRAGSSHLMLSKNANKKRKMRKRALVSRNLETKIKKILSI